MSILRDSKNSEFFLQTYMYAQAKSNHLTPRCACAARDNNYLENRLAAAEEDPRQSGSSGRQEDFPRRIPDSQDPPDTYSARGCRGNLKKSLHYLCLEDPDCLGSSWEVASAPLHQCPEDSDCLVDPTADTGAGGCSGTFPGGSQTVMTVSSA